MIRRFTLALFLLAGPLSAQSTLKEELTRIDAGMAEAGAMCIGSMLAVSDIARENGFTDEGLISPRDVIAENVNQLASDQDLLNPHDIYLRAIFWRDTFFAPAAEIVIPRYVAGEPEPEDAVHVLREGQNQCQERHRLKNMREHAIARDAAQR